MFVVEVDLGTKSVPRRGKIVALVPKASVTEATLLLLLICESVWLAGKASTEPTLLIWASESVLVLAALLPAEGPALLVMRTSEAARLTASLAAITHVILVSLRFEANVLSGRATTVELTTVLGTAVSSIAFPIESTFPKVIDAVLLATICRSCVPLPVEARIGVAIETSGVGCALATHAPEVVAFSSAAPCLAMHETPALPFLHRWRCRWPASSEAIRARLTTPSRSIEAFFTLPDTLAMSFPRGFLLVRGII